MTHWHAFLDMAVICLAFVAVCGLGAGVVWLADRARRSRARASRVAHALADFVLLDAEMRGDVAKARERTVPYDAVDEWDREGQR